MGLRLVGACTAIVMGVALPALAVNEIEEKQSAASEASSVQGVARSTFTSAISEREPVDSIAELTNDQDLIFFFTEIRGMEGAQVIHRWEFNGEVMGEVPFQVGGARWRVHSSKNLNAEWLGEWTVRIVDSEGNELGVNQFTYRKQGGLAQAEETPSSKKTATPESVPAAPADTDY